MSETIKLQIFAIIYWGIKYAFSNIRLILRCGAISLPVMFLSFMSISVYTLITENAPSDLIISPIAILAGSHFAVAWHRAILLNEKHPKIIRFGRAEIYYALFLLALNFGWAGIDALNKLPGQEDLNALGHGAGDMAVILFCLALSALLIVTNFLAFAFLPSIAVRDTRFSLARVWHTTKGFRIRYILVIIFIVLIFGFIMVGAIKIEGEFLGWSLRLIHFNFTEAREYGPDFFYFLAVDTLAFIPLTTLLFIISAAVMGSMSITYANFVRLAVKSDFAYRPPRQLNQNFAI
ncbi:MAG: hypothetical protein VB959_24445 [Rhodospirillales bacterium]